MSITTLEFTEKDLATIRMGLRSFRCELVAMRQTYLRPPVTDSDMEGFEALAATIAEVDALTANCMKERHVANIRIVKVETLRMIYKAMNYMGDILNNMDAVEAEDEEKTAPAFDAIRELLVENPDV